MAGRTRVVLNREALDAIDRAAADGMFELAKAVVFGARVPDAPPYGQGLLEGGGVIAFVKGRTGAARRVAETTIGGKTVKKPRAATIGREQIAVFGGFGFPGRMVETGTARTPAEPFLTPSLMERVPDAGGFIALAMVKHRIIASTRAAVGDTFGSRPTAAGARRIRATRRAVRGVGPA